jgi:nucleoside recognition membrane protein YjiH
MSGIYSTVPQTVVRLPLLVGQTLFIGKQIVQVLLWLSKLPFSKFVWFTNTITWVFNIFCYAGLYLTLITSMSQVEKILRTLSLKFYVLYP